MSALNRLLAPKTIAYVGGRDAERAIAQCRDLGFDGQIWPVHPRRPDVAGFDAFAGVADLPEAPDAAFIAVNRHASIEIVAELSARGAGGAVCYASGFAEVGDRSLQEALVEAAGDMPILGPNCYGYINAVDGLSLWPDEHGCAPVERGAALVAQSGNMALNLTMAALPLTHVVTLGNAAALSAGDCIDALLDDPRVTAIGLHLEAMSHTASFVDAARRSWRNEIPIVALKTGTSQRGSSIIATHTGALAGDAAMWEGLCRRYGVEMVDGVGELVEALTMLTVSGPIPGRRLASMSCSGGEAALIADRAAEHGMEFGALEAEEAASVAATLPHLESVSNPLDYHTFIWGNQAKLTATFAAMLGTPCDAGILILDMPTRRHNDRESWWAAAHAYVDAAAATGRPAVAIATLPDGMPEDLARYLRENGVAPLRGIDPGLGAMAIAAAFTDRPAEPPAAHPIPEGTGGSVTLDEPEAKRLLRDAGIAVPEGEVTVSPVDVADALGYPVVVKTIGVGHKSDMGHVGVGLGSVEEVAAWCRNRPAARYLVERFVAGAVAELLIGARSVPDMGTLLTVAAGGVLAELVHDTAHLVVPATDDAILEALRSLRLWKLLNGFRGSPPADIPAVVDCITRIGDLVASDPEVRELEVNPLLALPVGAGAVAVDALGKVGDGA